MQPTRRIKRKNGIDYWYEETPYYDKEKKQIRHKSKYLGRNVKGQPVRMRSAPDDIREATKKRPAQASSSYDYGSILILQTVMEELHLDQYLQEIFSRADFDLVRALAFNRIIRPTAMKNVGAWYEGTSLALDSPAVRISSQRISEFLARIGEHDIPDRFITKLLEGTGTRSTLIYDITSLSSYSQFINLLEYGYNREGGSLPQINLSLVLDKDKGIPVMYDIYPGSIADVSTVSNTLQKIVRHGIHDYIAIMDRGFFSHGNLEELLDNQLTFILAAKFQFKDLKLLLTKAQKGIDDVKYLQKFCKDTIFVKPISYVFDPYSVQGYVYYDPQFASSEQETLRTRLYDIREELQKVHLKRNSNAYVIFREKSQGFMNFFNWQVVDDHFEVKIKQNAVTQRMNRMGKYILFYSEDIDWLTCLTLYRERDEIEKAFNDIINEIDLLPLNTQSEKTTRGFIFVAFLSLIIRTRLVNKIREAGLLEKYSVELLLLQLEKLRKVVLADGQVMTTEITKRQREILDALKICT